MPISPELHALAQAAVATMQPQKATLEAYMGEEDSKEKAAALRQLLGPKASETATDVFHLSNCPDYSNDRTALDAKQKVLEQKEAALKTEPAEYLHTVKDAATRKKMLEAADTIGITSTSGAEIKSNLLKFFATNDEVAAKRYGEAVATASHDLYQTGLQTRNPDDVQKEKDACTVPPPKPKPVAAR